MLDGKAHSFAFSLAGFLKIGIKFALRLMESSKATVAVTKKAWKLVSATRPDLGCFVFSDCANRACPNALHLSSRFLVGREKETANVLHQLGELMASNDLK